MQAQALRHVLFGAACWAGLNVGATAAAAQEAAATEPKVGVLEEIVVTARRRAENIQDVPAAVTAVTGDQLQKQQIRSQNELQYGVPSLSLQGRSGHLGGTYALRGISGPSTGNPTVGTYFAEVPSRAGGFGFDPSAGASLYDLDSVQVLKGPQGTLFGRTSVAGAVLVTPKAPSLTGGISGVLDVLEGTLGRQEVTAAVNVPIVEDKVAVRLAFRRQHLDGYTHIIGTSQELDETNNYAYRVSLLVQPTSWLRSTTIYDGFFAKQAPGGYLLRAANTSAAPLNFGVGPLTGACTQAVALGLATSVPACVAERMAIQAKIRADMQSEVRRTAQGGGQLRLSNVGASVPFYEELNAQKFINTTVVDLPTFGALETSFKNIFGYQTVNGVTANNQSGTPDQTGIAVGGNFAGGSVNQAGNQAVFGAGKVNKFYTEEAQLNGRVGKDRFVFVLGYFYQRAPVNDDPNGITILQKNFGGVTTPNLGFAAQTFIRGGVATEKAFFAQGTLALGLLSPALEGFHFTAGARHSKNYSLQKTQAVTTNFVTGRISPNPAAPIVRTVQASDGDGYTLSLDYKVNADLLLYAAHRKGYVPGGVNIQIPNSNLLPGFLQTFGPETIKDIEVGAKWDFAIQDMVGRLNIAAYRQDYTDMQRQFSAVDPRVNNGQLVVFLVNSADSVLKGIEVEGVLKPIEALTLSLNYSYNDSKYKRYVGADPLNIIPGNNVDLSDNSFFNAPRHKLNVGVAYDLPLDPDLGQVTLSVTGYRQSLVWFSSAPQRNLAVYGATLPNLKDAISQKPYTLLNARIDWRGVAGMENLDASLIARNLTNEIIATSGLGQLNTLGTATKSYAEPRTFAVQLVYRFGG